MTDPIVIYEGQDFYVPYFQVKIGNQPLDRETVFDITQVSYRDSVEEIASFQITINNWDAETRRFKYSDGDKFNPGKKVELWMGYFGKDRQRLMITGEITQLRPTFPSGGQPTLGISGVDVLHRLRSRQESHAYRDRTDSQIAREVAGRLNVPIDTPSADEEKPYPYVLQANKYDVIFLLERVWTAGYDLFVQEVGENGQSQPPRLVFRRSAGLQRQTYNLKYGESLIEFTPTLTTANQVGMVRIQTWDSVNKRPILGEATRDELLVDGIGGRRQEREIDQSFRQRVEVIHDQPVANQAEANQLARDTLERIAKETVTATGSTIGLPDLRAGTILILDGLGDRFNGRYFVKSTTHTIGDSGYTTQFECRREVPKRG